MKITKKELNQIIENKVSKMLNERAQDIGDISGLAKIMKYKVKTGLNTWIIGITKDGKYKIQLMVFKDNSEDGINGGRISKLYINDVKTKDDVALYDRNWNVKPTSVKPLVAAIIKALK